MTPFCPIMHSRAWEKLQHRPDLKLLLSTPEYTKLGAAKLLSNPQQLPSATIENPSFPMASLHNFLEGISRKHSMSISGNCLLSHCLVEFKYNSKSPRTCLHCRKRSSSPVRLHSFRSRLTRKIFYCKSWNRRARLVILVHETLYSQKAHAKFISVFESTLFFVQTQNNSPVIKWHSTDANVIPRWWRHPVTNKPVWRVIRASCSVKGYLTTLVMICHHWNFNLVVFTRWETINRICRVHAALSRPGLILRRGGGRVGGSIPPTRCCCLVYCILSV